MIRASFKKLIKQISEHFYYRVNSNRKLVVRGDNFFLNINNTFFLRFKLYSLLKFAIWYRFLYRLPLLDIYICYDFTKINHVLTDWLSLTWFDVGKVAPGYGRLQVVTWELCRPNGCCTSIFSGFPVYYNQAFYENSTKCNINKANSVKEHYSYLKILQRSKSYLVFECFRA